MDNSATPSSNKATTIPSIEATKTAVSTSTRTVLGDNTSIFFKHFGSQFGKLRLSLLNISNSILHFKFKKSSGTKLAIEPQANGIIGKRSETIITITWDVTVSESVTPDGWPYVKMVLFLAIDGKFDDLDNCSLTRVVGYLQPNAEIFNENADADVLVVDIPNRLNSLRQQLSRTRANSPKRGISSISRQTSSLQQDVPSRQSSKVQNTSSVQTVSTELRPFAGIDSCRELQETSKSKNKEKLNIIENEDLLLSDVTQDESDDEKDLETAVTYVEGKKKVFVDKNALMVTALTYSDCDNTAAQYSDGEEEMPRSYFVGDDKPSHKLYRAARRASFYIDKGMQHDHAYYTDYSNGAVSSLIARGMMSND